MLLGFLTDKEPKLAVNGSTVTFKITGDLEVEASRHVIQYGKLNFVGTDPMTVNKTIEAYALGSQVFERFQVLEGLKTMYATAEKRVNTLPEENRDIVLNDLDNFRVQLYIMGQTLHAAADQSEEESQAFNAQANYIAHQLDRFIKAPIVFKPNVTPEEIMAAKVEDAMPGAKVTSITFVPDEEDNPIQEAQLIPSSAED